MEATFSVYRKINSSPSVAIHGQVHTKPHIVELMLDLAGYPGSALAASLLDPGCGQGAFIIAAAKRLIAVHGPATKFAELEDRLLGIEKDCTAADACRQRMEQALVESGVSARVATKLAARWIVQGDFLEFEFDRAFDFVVGNPPYVRQEAIEQERLERYREKFACFYDRADLYVAFFEQGLKLLRDGGTLAFICPDRFTKNNYGKKLRSLIATQFGVQYVLDLAQGSPFEPNVTCYPGIFVVGRGPCRGVDYFRLADGGPDECASVKQSLGEKNGKRQNGDHSSVAHHRYETWFAGEQQWSIESPEHLELLRRLESEGVAIGAAASGIQVGIGVATGADEVFIVDRDCVDVESELLMPLVTTKDIASGNVKWSGRCVINPFAGDSPDLIDLRKFHKARVYFERHRSRLEGRNVAQRDFDRWYRTIDRIYPPLQSRPKLLIPDIKAENLIVHEAGRLYPHHNLYFATSDYWDLRALRTILRSSIGKFFVWMYGVKMRGDYLRFQAQYLRRICVPPLMTLDKCQIKSLLSVDASVNQSEIDAVAAEVYGLSAIDMRLIGGIASPRTPT